MKRKIACLMLSSLLLFSCSTPKENNNKNEDGIIYNENETKVECVLGAFGLENGVYLSKKVNSLCILNYEFKEGTFISSFISGSSLQENGYVFNYKDENNFYFIGTNLTSNIIVSKVIEGKKEEIYKSSNTFKSSDSLKISIVKVDEKIEIYGNDEFLFEFKVDQKLNNSNYKVGLLAGSKNTTYKNINYIKDKNIYLSDFSYYRVVSGNFLDEDSGFVSSGRNSILVNDSRTFKNGTIEVDVSLSGDRTDNGIIFGLEENDNEIYFESGVSYYFYFVNLNGLAFLGKVNNGKWSALNYCTIKDFDEYGNYKLKIVKNEDKIYCFLDNEVVFMCIDDSIQGEKVALRAGGSSIGFLNLKIDSTLEEGDKEKYNIYEGKITSSSSHIETSENNSIATLKDFSFSEGTLKAKLIPGTVNNNGIIFKASKNEDKLSYYWLYFTSTGQIGFSKFTNDVEKREIYKFLPYGRSSHLAYNVKIVIENNDIYCYFDNRLTFLYHDEEILTGNEVGIKSTGLNTALFNLKITQDKEIESYEYLIFGHSYTEYWYTYKEDFSEYENIYDIGMGASNTYHWTNQYLNELIAYKAHYGIYRNGINDISAGYKASDIASNVEKLLTSVKEANPNFEVALVGVNRCPFASNKRNEISSVNALYKELAEKYDYVHYVEVEKLYCDSNGNELGKYFTDGLHPNHEGYKMAALLIKEALK